MAHRGDLTAPSLPGGRGQKVACKPNGLQMPLSPVFPSTVPYFLPLAFSSFSTKLTGAREGRGSQAGQRVVTFADEERPFASSLCLSVLAGEDIVSLKGPAIAKAAKPAPAWCPSHPTKSLTLHISDVVKLHFTIHPCKYPSFSSSYTCFMSLPFTQKVYRK